jgi:hypothetical protein
VVATVVRPTETNLPNNLLTTTASQESSQRPNSSTHDQIPSSPLTSSITNYCPNKYTTWCRNKVPADSACPRASPVDPCLPAIAANPHETHICVRLRPPVVPKPTRAPHPHTRNDALQNIPNVNTKPRMHKSIPHIISLQGP